MPTAPHAWDVTPEQARAIQQDLRDRVRTDDAFATPMTTIGGTDVGFEANGTVTRAAVVVLSFPDLELIEHQLARRQTTFPYIPGLLSFREIPALLEAWERLKTYPDVVLCDGHGIAHPRRLGIAAHFGVLLDVPTIGVAKKRLVGTHPPAPDIRGAWVELTHNGTVIGAMLRTRVGVKPVYVSSGHRVSLTSAIQLVMQATTRFRLPQATRLADQLASQRGKTRVPDATRRY